MQNLINDAPVSAPVKKNYDFIDAIRCIAMMGIVAEHSIYFEPQNYSPTGFNAWCYIGAIQFTKFGTIVFFLLAGFLIGDNFIKYTPIQYLKRRVSSTIWPWLFWSLLFLVVTNSDVIGDKLFHHTNPPSGTFLQYLINQVQIVYLHTIYWFIPNFLFCIAILLIFKKYLYNYIFGGVLLLFSLFYCVNIYFSWIPPNHTTAILGFVFFLWLGAQLHKRQTEIESWLKRTPIFLWVVLTLITFIAAIAETEFLRTLHNSDPYNSLRFTNVLYSLAVFLLLFKIRHFDFIKILKPRETTYGVYLIHYIFVIRILNATFYGMHVNLSQLGPLVLFSYQFIRFVYMYVMVIIIVLLINKSKLKWLIGR